MRIEKDMLGEIELIDEGYYGIHTKRAMDNFNLHTNSVNLKLIKEIALIKKAAAMVNQQLGQLDDQIAKVIMEAADEVIEGKLNDSFVVSALQGGAGTSTNMNVNEVIANRAIELLGGTKGDYAIVDPLNHVNMSQSTNDVYPTALRIAAIRLLRELADELSLFQTALQEKENAFSDSIRLGRTQLMDALPMMVGQGFGAYAKAAARDRWRIYKVEERLRQINLGGTAIGTGMNASLKYIYMVTDAIQSLTGLGLARSEYPMDITQNTDVFVEVSGLLKACSVNMMKIANDLRLLGSGPKGGLAELRLPQVQAGSSIMPGKVNPVIPEMVAQVAMKVMANDHAITMASASGQLELNAFMPLIADSLLESLELLRDCTKIFREKCIEELEVNQNVCKEHLEHSSALVTALVHHIGYHKASDIAKEAMAHNKTISEVVLERGLMTEEKLKEILNPYAITKPGIPGQM
ncbi:aspartate ammonia-lyase [Vallitalea okinawensis]|uniref:aspartate ammonia-lyase n=1 Tax=Vallitalea okinawensis TaxID=2078660 RepID=UPI000CFB3C2D|nr:aspartate ammonia-lyase [Vallitalea okinawensis]